MNYNQTIPIQYEQGKACFMGMEVKVDQRVLIPRPETELLVKVVADLCRKRVKTRARILDIGTGSGVIPLGIVKLLGDCEVIAADICEEALSVAYENLQSFGYESKVKLLVSNMFSSFRQGYKDFFDCIVSNPPYVSDRDYEKLDPWVKAEPRVALYAGKNGMDHLNVIASEGIRFLASGGFAAVEVGYDQAERVKKSFQAGGFTNIKSFIDFSGYERVIVGFKDG